MIAQTILSNKRILIKGHFIYMMNINIYKARALDSGVNQVSHKNSKEFSYFDC